MKLVWCVPNFSEGRRPEVIEGILAAIRNTPGVRLLDHSSNPSHNRLVVSFVGEPAAVRTAALEAASAAAALIDMREHRGEHPRMGATDVIPLVPLSGSTMAECVDLAREIGRELADRLGIPVYLYEHAATRPERKNLANVRRGEYEGLKETISTPERAPDFGPAVLHPTAGATAVGARPPLIAFNVNLGTADIGIANRIGRAVRESSGGLTNVKAIGVMLEERNLAQVSMNLVDHTRTPVYRVFELIRAEAARYGVDIVGSEVVGLVPLSALLDVAAYYLRLEGFTSSQVVEVRLAEGKEAELS